MELTKILNLEHWNKFQAKTASLTNFRLALIDSEGKPVSAVSGQQAFCSALLSNPDIRDYYSYNRKLVLRQAVKTGQPCLYQCQFGLVDTIIPIIVEGQVWGALAAGQVRLKDSPQIPVIQAFKKIEIPRFLIAQHREDFQAVPQKTFKEIQETIEFLLEACTYLISESLTKTYFINAYKQALHLEVPSAKIRIYRQPSTKCDSDHLYKTQNKILQPAVDAVLTNKSVQFTLNELAKLTNLSPAYLSRLIKEEFNEPFSQLYRELKMQWATEFLADPSLSIREISSQLGYLDPSYFIRVFKQTRGITPLKYRKQLLVEH